MIQTDIIESYISDPDDLVKMAEAFFQVPDPLTGEWTPIKNYDYGKEYLQDENDTINILKSRQAGISWVSVMKALIRSMKRERYRKIYISIGEREAGERIQDAKDMLGHLQHGLYVPLKKDQAYHIQLADTGSSLRALPASDHKSGRGYNADVCFDEMAFMEESAIKSAAQGTVRRGWKLERISTPFGQIGAFFNLWFNANWDVDSIWHDVSQVDAFNIEYQKFRDQITDEQSYYVIPWFMCPDIEKKRALNRAGSEENFLQEFCLKFADEARSIFPMHLMRDSIKEYDLYNLGNIPVSQSQRIMGIDIAHGGNETAIVISERFGHVWKVVYLWHKKAKKDEYIPLVSKLHHGFKTNAIYADETGIGNVIVPEMRKRISMGNIQGVFLTTNKKEEIINNMVSQFEGGGMIIPKYDILTKQLHAVRGKRTSGGRERITGKGFNTNDDLVWALGLSLYPLIESGYSEPIEMMTFDFNPKGEDLFLDDDDDDEEEYNYRRY